jgi:hypothetical protein
MANIIYKRSVLAQEMPETQYTVKQIKQKENYIQAKGGSSQPGNPKNYKQKLSADASPKVIKN